MREPRIYIMVATFHPLVGGAERQALLQGRALRARGYEATVITLRHERAWARCDVLEGVPVVRVAGAMPSGRQRLPAPLRKLAYLLGVLAMGWALWQRRRSFDLLHVYQLNVLTVPAAIACVLSRKALVVGLRSSGAGRPKDGGSTRRGRFHPVGANAARRPLDDVRDPISRRQVKPSGDLEALKRLGTPFVGLTRYLLQRAGAAVVVLTACMKADLAAHGFSTAAVRVIPNGVDLTQFRPTGRRKPPAEQAEQTDVVLYVGRLSYEKGVDVLLRAWRIVQDTSRASRTQLIIVGAGPRQAQLERQAVTSGIAKSVEFVGLQHNVVEWLNRSSLLVLPSRWEGMPNALLEAMACALPCIATRVSGSEEVIQHGVNGLLVEPEDDQALAEALLTLLRAPELRQEFGRAARATIERCYTFEHVIGVYLDLYRTLFASARGSRRLFRLRRPQHG